jgi:hypothetical protein
MRFIEKNHRFLFYTAWLLLALVQAGATELMDDEAYYHVYSEFLAWGYFDHPPMIAFLIKAGSAIFPNEFGVRLLIVLFNTGSLFLIEELTQKKNPYLFYAICLSIAVAQVGGFIAVPDVPLLFFVALFFYVYRNFVREMSTRNSLFLALSIALMLYTKYHGFLIVLFTLISNPGLFRRHQTYLVALVSIILFLPHMYWQYLHGYPSLQFHLFERNASSYRATFTIEYILGQVVLAGPLVGWLLLYSSFRYKPTDLLERALKFSVIGFYLFFLVSTLKGRVEANWTLPAFVGLIVLSHQYLHDHLKQQRWVYNLLPAVLAMIIALRIYMVVDTAPARWISKDEVHQNNLWVNEVKQISNGVPIVFVNSYQKASKFCFYGRAAATSFNTPGYRRNNFNYWPIEDSLINKPAYVVGPCDSVFLTQKFNSPHLQKRGGTMVDKYYAFSKVQFTDIKCTIEERDKLALSFEAKTPEHYLDFFQQPGIDTCTIQLAIMGTDEILEYVGTGIRVNEIVQTKQRIEAVVRPKLKAGKYLVRLGISSCVPGHPSLNSSYFTCQID